MEQYQIGKVLGDGTFGSVMKAVDTTNGQVVAIKQMKSQYYKWEDCINLPQIKSLMKFHHPNIVNLYEIIKHNNQLYFVFEYMEQNVYQLMKDRQKGFTETQIRNVIYQTLQGLAYMHRHGYFHRDMKPENLLQSNNTIKIADFGLAREIRSKPPFTDYVSTRWYRAPQVIMRAPNYNSPIDIFAVGAIMAQLYRQWPLFPGASERDQIVKICQVMGTPSQEEWPEGYKLSTQVGFQFPQHPVTPLSTIIPNASQDAIDLMTLMLKYNPSQRPSAVSALQHPYFQCSIPIPQSVNFDFSKLEKEPEEIQNNESQSQNTFQEMPIQDMIQELLGEKENQESINNYSGNYLQKSRYQPGFIFNQINEI